MPAVQDIDVTVT